jgi:hypothetical protein
MAVYVDDAGIPFRGKRRHHLTADTFIELHGFAARIGVARCWHHAAKRHPHYDVTDEQREAAIAAGAFAVNPKVLAVKSAGCARSKGMVATVVVFSHLGPVTYRAPEIGPWFSSPMHSAENLAASDWDIGARVCHRLKPVGVIHIPDSHEADREQAMAVVRESGGVAVQYREDAPGLIAITIDGVIGETFDLDALQRDYDAWCSRIRAPGRRAEVTEDIRAELTRLRPMRFSDFADFGKVIPRVHPDRDGHEPGGWVRCGLLFGYPPATTAALVLRDAGVPGAGSDMENMKGVFDSEGLPDRNPEGSPRMVDGSFDPGDEVMVGGQRGTVVGCSRRFHDSYDVNIGGKVKAIHVENIAPADPLIAAGG